MIVKDSDATVATFRRSRRRSAHALSENPCGNKKLPDLPRVITQLLNRPTMSSSCSSAEVARMRRNATGVALLLLGVAALYWPDTWALGRYWLDHDINAQTGILIAVLSGFLLFRTRGQLERIPTGPVPSASLPLIACTAASLICWRAGMLTLQLIFVPPILWLSLL